MGDNLDAAFIDGETAIPIPARARRVIRQDGVGGWAWDGRVVADDDPTTIYLTAWLPLREEDAGGWDVWQPADREC